MDLMDGVDVNGACVNFDFMNLRGFQCTNCTCLFYHNYERFPHVDWPNPTPCSSGNPPNSVHTEDSFGFFGAINTDHRCSMNSSATTQWWFGNLH